MIDTIKQHRACERVGVGLRIPQGIVERVEPTLTVTVNSDLSLSHLLQSAGLQTARVSTFLSTT